MSIADPLLPLLEVILLLLRLLDVYVLHLV